MWVIRFFFLAVAATLVDAAPHDRLDQDSVRLGEINIMGDVWDEQAE